MRKNPFVLAFAWLLLASLAAPAWATIFTNNNISATTTSQTITVGTTAQPKVDVLVANNTGSADTIYYQIFTCAETSRAATTADVALLAGETRSYVHSPTEGGGGYCKVSVISAGTATVRVEAK